MPYVWVDDPDDYATTHGHCEDYPCCGHRLGQCRDKPEYHAQHWREMMDKLDPDEYDRYCEIIDRQEAGY